MSKPKQNIKQDTKNTKDPKPFDRGFVIDITLRHMRRDVDISIKKTMERMPEFESDPVKAQEVFKTLSQLHQLKKLAEGISFSG